jgi:hypothetical protein
MKLVIVKMAYETMHTGGYLPSFRRNMLHPSHIVQY